MKEREVEGFYRVGDKVEFKYRSRTRGTVWINAEVERAYQGMYGVQTYTIWLPDFRKIKDYVSSRELRLRRVGGLKEDYERLLRNHDEILRNHNEILQAQRQREARELKVRHAQPLELDMENIGVNRSTYPGRLAYRTKRHEIGRYESNNCAGSFGSSRGRGRNREVRSSSVARTDNESFGSARRQRSTSLPPLNYTWPKLFAQFAHHALTKKSKNFVKSNVAKEKASDSKMGKPKGNQFKGNTKGTNDDEVNIKAPSAICKMYNFSSSLEHGDSKEEVNMSQDSTKVEQEVSKIDKKLQVSS